MAPHLTQQSQGPHSAYKVLMIHDASLPVPLPTSPWILLSFCSTSTSHFAKATPASLLLLIYGKKDPLRTLVLSSLFSWTDILLKYYTAHLLSLSSLCTNINLEGSSLMPNLHPSTYLFPKPALFFSKEYYHHRIYQIFTCLSACGLFLLRGKFHEGRDCFCLLLCHQSQEESQVSISIHNLHSMNE